MMRLLVEALTGRIGIALICSVLVGAGSLYKGYSWGKSVAEAQHQKAIDKLNAELADVGNDVITQEVKRLHAERERDELLENLDAEAAASPNASRPALDVDSVRRLNRL